MAGRPIDLEQLKSLVLSYFKTEEPSRRLSREQFYTQSMRIVGRGRNVQEALTAEMNANRLVHFWCKRGNAERLAELLSCSLVDLELESEEGTPLCIAARHGHVEIVDLLLKAGVSLPQPPLSRDRCSGNPWFECCAAASSTVFHLLLTARARSDPLPQAALDLLLEATVEGSSLAANSGLEIARSLMELGASVNGHGLVFAAFQSGCGRLLAELLSRGADCDPGAVQFETRDQVLRDALERLLERRPMRSEGDSGLVAALPTGIRLARLGPEHLPDASRLCELTLTDCGLTTLPAGLLHSLRALRMLDVSNNRIMRLEEAPEGLRVSSTLAKLDLSGNQLSDLPTHLFSIESMLELCLSRNSLGKGSWCNPGGPPWACRRLELLDVSANGLKSLPPQVNDCTRLVRLIAKENLLRAFPCWNCPLEILDLSSNEIGSVPVGVSNLWQTCLRELKLSDNHLSALPVPLLSLKNLSRLSLAHNMLRSLPDAKLWLCQALFDLDLSNNLLEEQSHYEISGFLFKKTLVFDSESQLIIPALSGLHRLNLSRNRLRRVPPSVCNLRMLETLDISGNALIRQIPVELAKCQQLMRLVCDPVQLQEPLRQFVQNGYISTIPLLSHLRLQLYRTSPYYHIKLVIAGNDHEDRERFRKYLGFGTDYAQTARMLYLNEPVPLDSPNGTRYRSLDLAVQRAIVDADPQQKRLLRDTLRRPPAQIHHMQLTQRQMQEMWRKGDPDSRRTRVRGWDF